MNNLNSIDDVVECPLCMEPLEVDDLNFFPCTCGYQICRFCWHRIRTDENELCPACRKEYPENPADFKPLTQEEMVAFKSQKRQRDQQRKQKITENRKHLANVRVVQKNLVFVVGLPPRLADADILKKHEYFGKYGKIHKVVINPSTAYAGVQGPSASAYVTYVHNADALRAIQSVNNIMIDGRLIKTSLGTTKYCSHFMKNQQCPKGDCMYLHELGDPEASFTKEEMHQGKHQEYEKRLHDFLIASSGLNPGCVVSAVVASSTNSNKTSEINKTSSTVSNTTSYTKMSTSSTSTTSNTSSSICSAPQKEAWPSLSISPVNSKELLSSSGNKHKKDRSKQEKNKIEKQIKSKLNKNNCSNSLFKDGDVSITISNSVLEGSTTSSIILNEPGIKSKTEKSKDRNQTKKEADILEMEAKEFEEPSKAVNATTRNFNSSCKIRSENIPKVDSLLSISDISNNSASFIIPTSENNSVIIGNSSGKSTPGSFNENIIAEEHTNINIKTNNPLMSNVKLETRDSKPENRVLLENSTKAIKYIDDLFVHNTASSAINLGQRNNDVDDSKNSNEVDDNNYLEKDKTTNKSLLKGKKESDTITDSISHLKLFDGNSFFSSSAEPTQIRNIEDCIHNQIISGNAPNLPDLITDIQSFSNNYFNNSDLNRQSSFLQQQLLQHQSTQNLNENGLHKSLSGTNMSKFFDFHKHQQQKLQQHCLQMSGSNNLNGNMMSENFNVLPVMDNNRLNSQLVDQNCCMPSQHHKQNVFRKIDQMLCHQTFQQNKQFGSSKSQQHQYLHSSTGDDDLGFDPFIETQKALAELIENEEEQQNTGSTISSNLMPHSKGNNVQQPQQHMDYMQRARMPPPGFTHVNNFSSYGVVPRLQNSSKIMPFINLSNNYTTPPSQHIQHQLQIPSNAWNTHLGNFQQHISEQQICQINSSQISNCSNQKGYTSNDWTAMDPAILSFRQFSFPPQTQITPQLQPQQQEIFLQQLAQQQQQTGFNQQSQHLVGGNVGLSNTMVNSQSGSQPHVNANVQGMLEYLKTRQFF